MCGARARSSAAVGARALLCALALALACAVSVATPARAAASPQSVEQSKSPVGRPTALGKDDFANEKISEKDPPFSLSFEFLGYSIIKIVWTLFSSLADHILSLAEWFLKLAGSSATSISQQDFGTGSFAGFYKAAKKVSSYAMEPYAFAGLGVVFTIWLIRSSDPRRRQTGDDWFAELLAIIAMFAVSATLIAHAVDLCGGLYWLGQNLVKGVSRALSEIGMAPGTGDVQLRDVFMEEMNAITYGQAGSIFILLLLSFVALSACCACCFIVLAVLFTRMAKIYLEATVSPIALAMLVDERTRHIGLGYIRGFLALCLQAALVFLALALAPLMFTVAASIVEPLVDNQSGIGGLAAAMGALLPAMTAIFSITSIVKASEPIANRLLGVSR